MNDLFVDEQAGILAAIENIHDELKALRLELALTRVTTKSARRVRYERRRDLLKQLSHGLGIDPPYPCAGEIVLILSGKRAAPPGMENIVSTLQRDEECPASIRRIYEAIVDDR